MRIMLGTERLPISCSRAEVLIQETSAGGKPSLVGDLLAVHIKRLILMF